MRYTYFVLWLSYDGRGTATLSNDVIERRAPLATSTPELRRLESQLSEELSGGQHVLLLNLALVGQEQIPEEPHAARSAGAQARPAYQFGAQRPGASAKG